MIGITRWAYWELAVGGTQLAVEFAYRFSFYFEEGGIFWIQAARIRPSGSNSSLQLHAIDWTCVCRIKLVRICLVIT